MGRMSRRRRGATGPADGDKQPRSRRPELPVDEEVDLHGLAVDEALAAAGLALERHRGKKGIVIRFIHGHSSGMSGSIKGALKRNLETVWKGWIQAARPEPGNPGSTLVKMG